MKLNCKRIDFTYTPGEEIFNFPEESGLPFIFDVEEELTGDPAVMDAVGEMLDEAEKLAEKAKAALETVANLDAGKLIDAGKVDDLKMEIKKSYDGKISDLEKALADSKKDSADRLAAKEASIRTLLVKGIFDSSAFLKDKTVLPPTWPTPRSAGISR